MLAMNAKEAARVCPTICIRISHDTLLKTLRRAPVPSEQPDIIGIDDFAFKKDIFTEQSSAMHKPIVQSNYSVHGILKS